MLVGHSRKGFLGKLIGDKEADRTTATVAAALAWPFRVCRLSVSTMFAQSAKPLPFSRHRRPAAE